MFKVRGADQNEYGPITTEVLRDWIRQRRVIGTSLAQREGTSEWKPASAFPEFADLFGPPPIMAQGAPPPPPVGAERTSGLAITSLICGILGCFLVSALAGLVFGIVGLVKINGSRGTLKGKGLAVAGIVLSSMFLLMMPGLLLPALAKAKARAQAINCSSNLRAIGLAARMWSNDHGEKFPPDFGSMSNELASPKILVCSADSTKTVAASLSQVGLGNISYEYLTPGEKEADLARTPVFRCPIHGHICYGDGSVEMGTKFGSRRQKGNPSEK